MSNEYRLPSFKALLNPIEDDENHSHRTSQHDGAGAYRSFPIGYSETLSADMGSKQLQTSKGQRLPSVNELLKSSQREHAASGSRHSASFQEKGRSEEEYRNTSTAKTANQKHPCKKCGRLFSRKADATKHIRVVHERVKDFSCCVCGRKFARKDYCTVRSHHKYTTW